MLGSCYHPTAPSNGRQMMQPTLDLVLESPSTGHLRILGIPSIINIIITLALSAHHSIEPST